jgi:hypothetical protein
MVLVALGCKMKRSEMVAKLSGYLMDYRRENDNSAYNARDLAVFVLECVERQGMLPPNMKRIASEIERAYDDSCEYDETKGEWLVTQNEWEPED